MAQHEAQHETEPRDSWRVQTTGRIWSYATAMLGISIPLTAIASGHGGAFAMLIPLTVVAGAAAGTIAVWNPFARSQSAPAGESERVAELEERVASLEMILSYEEKLLDAKLRQQPVLAQTTAPDANAFAISGQDEPAAVEIAPAKPRRRSSKTKREVAQ